jgi:hypothetical protein
MAEIRAEVRFAFFKVQISRHQPGAWDGPGHALYLAARRRIHVAGMILVHNHPAEDATRSRPTTRLCTTATGASTSAAHPEESARACDGSSDGWLCTRITAWPRILRSRVPIRSLAA